MVNRSQFFYRKDEKDIVFRNVSKFLPDSTASTEWDSEDVMYQIRIREDSGSNFSKTSIVLAEAFVFYLGLSRIIPGGCVHLAATVTFELTEDRSFAVTAVRRSDVTFYIYYLKLNVCNAFLLLKILWQTPGASQRPITNQRYDQLWMGNNSVNNSLC
jgi:hypothetical protein